MCIGPDAPVFGDSLTLIFYKTSAEKLMFGNILASTVRDI